MQSEALRKIRTAYQVKTSFDVARKQELRTTNSLSKTGQEMEHLELFTDMRLGQILAKERRKFVAQESAVNKSRHRILRARERLSATINKNRALTELRHELQRARWEGKKLPPPKPEQPNPGQRLQQVELRY